MSASARVLIRYIVIVHRCIPTATTALRAVVAVGEYLTWDDRDTICGKDSYGSSPSIFCFYLSCRSAATLRAKTANINKKH